jgi:hypothetical protein
VRFLIKLPIAKFRLPISIAIAAPIKSAMGNRNSAMSLETPNGGQGAKRPDRFLAKSG